QGRYRGEIDPEIFKQQYASFDRSAGLSPAVIALLSFVKVNASEAYGTEFISSIRYRTQALPDTFHRVEQIIVNEEHYHTKILVGAVKHLEVEPIEGAWQPSLLLKAL